MESTIVQDQLIQKPNIASDFTPGLSTRGIEQIVRSEMSAVEAYQHVLYETGDFPESERLINYLFQHESAISFWKRELRTLKRIPEQSDCTWGTIVSTIMAVTNYISIESAIKALISGENYSLNMYEEFSRNPELSISHQITIKNRFIPIQMKRIDKLRQLLDNMH